MGSSPVAVMEYLWFSKDVFLWFKSYLSNTKIKANLSKTFSEPGKLLCGVPHGYILEPLLFLLYVNDKSQAVKCELLLYVDDTCLIFQQNDIRESEIQFNKKFSSICDWFVDNKLSIYFWEDKTNSILSRSKCKIKKTSPLNIQHKDIKVKQYAKVTYLGCILDETLSGESMSTHVDKISFCIFLFVDCYVTQWYSLSLIMHVTIGTVILTKILKTVYKLLRTNVLNSA